MSKFANSEMCRLTEKVIFSEPYTVASNNNYLPQLEADVKELQADTQAKVWGGEERRERGGEGREGKGREGKGGAVQGIRQGMAPLEVYVRELQAEIHRPRCGRKGRSLLLCCSRQSLFNYLCTRPRSSAYLHLLPHLLPHVQVAVSLLKEKFVHKAEALLHGDLHTGSIMVTQEQS